MLTYNAELSFEGEWAADDESSARARTLQSATAFSRAAGDWEALKTAAGMTDDEVLFQEASYGEKFVVVGAGGKAFRIQVDLVPPPEVPACWSSPDSGHPLSTVSTPRS